MFRFLTFILLLQLALPVLVMAQPATGCESYPSFETTGRLELMSGSFEGYPGLNIHSLTHFSRTNISR